MSNPITMCAINTKLHTIGDKVVAVLFGAKPGIYNGLVAHRRARLFYKNKKEAEKARIELYVRANILPIIMYTAQNGGFSYTEIHMPVADWKIAARYLRSIGYHVSDKHKVHTAKSGCRLMHITW